jgi:hypothetical protein
VYWRGVRREQWAVLGCGVLVGEAQVGMWAWQFWLESGSGSTQNVALGLVFALAYLARRKAQSVNVGLKGKGLGWCAGGGRTGVVWLDQARRECRVGFARLSCIRREGHTVDRGVGVRSWLGLVTGCVLEDNWREVEAYCSEFGRFGWRRSLECILSWK